MSTISLYEYSHIQQVVLRHLQYPANFTCNFFLKIVKVPRVKKAPISNQRPLLDFLETKKALIGVNTVLLSRKNLFRIQLTPMGAPAERKPYIDAARGVN